MLETPENDVYQKAKKVWDQRIGSALLQAYNWRVLAFSSMLVSLCSIAGNIYLGSQKKVIPYIVEIRANGESSVLGTAESLQSKTKDRAIAYFLSRFVLLAREIPADAVLIRNNMNKLFQLVTMQGKGLLAEKFKEINLLDEFKEKNRALEIASVLGISKDTFQIDWFEAEYDKQGQKIAEHPMRGTFKVAFLEPSDQQIKENPLGIFVDYFSWTSLGG
jgi:type IV secretory pathway TrbF-like protein